MGTSRPICVFGAAFLLTAAAALLAPTLLLFLALPIAFALLFLPGGQRGAVVALGVGCLTALLASGFFFVGLHRASALTGHTVEGRGAIFYEGGQQLGAVTLEDGSRRLVRLFPPLEGAEAGDFFQGKLTIRQVMPESSYYLQGRGVLLEALPLEAAVLAVEEPPPFFIRVLLLREQLCQGLLRRTPTLSGSVTVAILFSYTDALPAPLREAFSRSGMGHLLAVSGLHLSILVWWAVALVKRLRGGRWLQALVGTLLTLLVFFAAGMSPSVFRAALMTLLTLLAGLLRRKSDALTSLTLAAVLLVGLCPPILFDLSFQLSFAAVLGILLLSPRLSHGLEQLCISRFSSCGRLTQGLIGMVSASAGAQLATAPLVALVFGQLPLLGLPINLLAIPLVYPVLLCGFAAALLPVSGISALLLGIANLFSGLLALVAAGAARLPFCSLRVIFPGDLLPVLPATLFCLLLAFCPLYKIRFKLSLAAVLGLTLLFLGLHLWVTENSLLVASSSVTGSLSLTYRGSSVLLESTQSSYHRRLDARRLERLGTPSPQLLLLPHPDETPAHTAMVQDFYGLAPRQLYTAQQLKEPVILFPGITVRVSQPYLTEIELGSIKLMKFYTIYDTIVASNYCTELCATDRLAAAVFMRDCPKMLCIYDTMDKLKLPTGSLLADRQGNLLALGGRPYLLRRANGDSFARIYLK